MFICSFTATDPNSSFLPVVGTPLKAIENVYSSVVAGSLDGSGNDSASVSGIDQPTFVHPQQTSTPAARRISPKRLVPQAKVLPAFAVSVLPSGGYQSRPAVLSRVDGATAGSNYFSQDGGFLPESQTVMQVQRSIRPDVVDLTVDEVNDAVTNSQFKPVVVSTQISDGPIATSSAGSHVSKVLCRISNFENSFTGDDNLDVVAENKFKPVAVSTQISLTRNAEMLKFCPRNGNFVNSFASETLVNGMLESDNGNMMEAGAGPAAVSVMIDQDEDSTVSKPCDTSELSQSCASRSPSPELFDCDVAVSDKVEAAAEVKPASTVNSPSNSECDDRRWHAAVTSDDNTNSSRQPSASHTTLAQKLASRKLYAKDSVNDLVTITGNHDPAESEKTLVAMSTCLSRRAAGSVKEVENSSAQARRSSRLSNRSKMSLRDSKCQSRGVDFVDEIDEVILYIFLFLCCILHLAGSLKISVHTVTMMWY